MDETLTLPFKEIDPVTILYAVYVLIAAYIIVWIAANLLTRLSERSGQYRIAVDTLIPLIKVFVYSVAAYIVVTAFVEPSLSELVAFAGFFGAGVGFGLKDLFADIVGALVITFERPFQIGDKITVEGEYGEVVDIGIRSTRIITPDDNQISLPNSLIFTKAVSSANAGSLSMMVVIDLFIDTESDPDRARTILRDALVTSKYVYISEEHPCIILLEDFPWYLRVRARGYVTDLRFEFVFISDVTARAWAEYARQGIKPPSVVPGIALS
ncbi:MAG TPA: mechanosensitive ion channel [Methanofollis liminatans]|uniref:Mechanosensitive ion channel n=1 Tax=Methanofollis liminatans TaxID=2201 RepID=A0A831LE66_9EURY|nr:mechanosensitive ion channel [Methanofollis liminatans]